MSYIVVDNESDGPIPGIYSLVCFGAVVVDGKFDKRFYGQTSPISEKYELEALSISGFTRAQHLKFPEPLHIFTKFYEFIKNNTIGKPIFISDNPAYDWQFTNYYFHKFIGNNPFGWSARRIGDLYSGIKGDMRAGWKHLRKTQHDHNPMNDALGNAKALWEIIQKYNIKGFN